MDATEVFFYYDIHLSQYKEIDDPTTNDIIKGESLSVFYANYRSDK